MTEKEMKVILAEGEGYRIEFKEKVSDLDSEMVAFANASGGRIFVGITDSGEVKGIKIDNALKSRIQDIANNCDPELRILLEEYKNILIIHVREGLDKPYKCSSGFYIRTGPNAQKLDRNQIVGIMKSEGKIRYDELIKKDFKLKDLDPEKIKRFLRLAGISQVLDRPLLYKNLGIAELQEGKLYFNNLAVLFFAKHLKDIYFHTVVTCALYNGLDKSDVLDRKDFNDDLISSVDYAMNFLKQNLPVRYKFTGDVRRVEIPQIPLDALREAIINAVVHRDYFEKGMNVMVEVYSNRVEITNPGGLVKGLTPQNFGTMSVLRNPGIAGIFHRVEYIEKMGTGIERIRRALRKAKVPTIKYEFNDVWVRAIFPRLEVVANNQENQGKLPQKLPYKTTHELPMKTAQETILETVPQTVLETILENIKKKPKIKRIELAALTGLSLPGIKYHLSYLNKEGYIRHEGPTKKGYWVILKELDK